MTFSRRDFLGLSSLLIASCASPTYSIADDDDMPPRPPPPPPRRCAGATADNIEGPFYKAGAPHNARLATSRDQGTPFLLTGTVLSASCEPLAGAELDLWHADATGAYDNAGFKFRGALTTDAQGRYKVRTIIPGRYLNGDTYRPAHIHVKVRAVGHGELTTQLYFEGDPYNQRDPFIVESLIMKHVNVFGTRRAAFDFVLA